MRAAGAMPGTVAGVLMDRVGNRTTCPRVAERCSGSSSVRWPQHSHTNNIAPPWSVTTNRCLQPNLETAFTIIETPRTGGEREWRLGDVSSAGPVEAMAVPS